MKVTPIIIADQPKLRVDESGKEYYVVFDKPSIDSIVKAFAKKGQHTDLNLFINEPTNENFDKEIPEGSLMGIVPPDYDGGLSLEFKIEK